MNRIDGFEYGNKVYNKRRVKGIYVQILTDKAKFLRKHLFFELNDLQASFKEACYLKSTFL